MSAPPDQVIRLYPKVIAGDLSASAGGQSESNVLASEPGQPDAPDQHVADDESSVLSEVEPQPVKDGDGNPSTAPSGVGTAAMRAAQRLHLVSGSDTESIQGKHSEVVSEDKPLGKLPSRLRV